MPPRRTARSVTLDTNVLEADEIIKAGRRCGFEISVVTVTGREVEKSSYKAHLKNLGTVLETAVWDESPWGSSVWGSPESADTLEMIVGIISNGSFPARRARADLSKGQRRQLRDAMIFEAHVRSGRDIFVTDDRRGFVRGGLRESLETQFATRIMTRKEFAQFVAYYSEDDRLSD